MVGNIVEVGWATSKSGCLPITDNSSLTVGVGTRRLVIIRPWDQTFKGRFIHRMIRPRNMSSKGHIIQEHIIQGKLVGTRWPAQIVHGIVVLGCSGEGVESRYE